MPGYDAQPATPTGILVDIVNFVSQHHRKLWEIMEQKGGWEGWLQVELAFLINDASSSSYTAERELSIFKKQRQRVDIWATETGTTGQLPNIGIELKCESQYQDATVKDGFKGRLTEDILKILGGIQPQYTKGCGARIYAVGVTTNPNDLKGYDDLAQYGVQIKFVQTQSTMHWVLWWYQDFPKT